MLWTPGSAAAGGSFLCAMLLNRVMASSIASALSPLAAKPSKYDDQGFRIQN